MIIIVKPGAEPAQVQDLVEFVHAQGLKTSVVTGTEKVIIGVIGDTRLLDEDQLFRSSSTRVTRRASPATSGPWPQPLRPAGRTASSSKSTITRPRHSATARSP